MIRRMAASLLLLGWLFACSRPRTAKPADDGLAILSGRPWQIDVKATMPGGEEDGKVVPGEVLFIEGDRHLYLGEKGNLVDQGRYQPLGGRRLRFRNSQGHMDLQATEVSPTRVVLKGVLTMMMMFEVQVPIDVRLTPWPGSVHLPVPANLHEAARLGDVAAIDRLLPGTKVDALEDGATPLMLAARHCHPAAVQRLLRAGAQPDLAGEAGQTPLMLATDSGDVDVITLLLASKANPRLRSAVTRETPLTSALHNGDIDAMRTLVEGGAPLDERDETGSSILCTAAMGDPLSGHGRLDIVSYLLGKKVDVNQPCAGDSTPIFMAIEGNQPQTARLLLEHGANLQVRDSLNRTPEEAAQDKPEVLAILREHKK